MQVNTKFVRRFRFFFSSSSIFLPPISVARFHIYFRSDLILANFGYCYTIIDIHSLYMLNVPLKRRHVTMAPRPQLATMHTVGVIVRCG